MTPPFDVADLRDKLNLDLALRTHLAGNHFPPLHPDFDKSALAAIDEVNAYRPHTQIIMANGRQLKAVEIVTQLHLDGFLGEHCEDEFYADNIEGNGAGEIIDHCPA